MNQNRQPKGIPAGGQFAASQRNEGGLALAADPYRPMSREEFGQWSQTAQNLRLLDTRDHTLALPDGATVTVVPADPILDAADGVGDIVETGQYNITRPDGSFAIVGFTDLTDRAQRADRIAQNVVLESRGEGAHLDLETGEPVGDTAPDPYEGSYAEQAAGIESGTGPRDDFWADAEIIHAYTRTDAIRDGVLKDYTSMAKEAGITWPVAVTAEAHADAIAWNDRNAGLQDETGRAWDVVNMAGWELRRRMRDRSVSKDIRPGDRIPFSLVRVPNTPRATQPRKANLDLVFGLTDDGQPCWTVTTPGQD